MPLDVASQSADRPGHRPRSDPDAAAERDEPQQRLRLHFGAESEAGDRAHLTARAAELEDELTAARERLRRVVESH